MRKIQRRYCEYEDGLINNGSFNQSFQSALGILSHCHGYKTKEKLEKIIK